MLTGAIREALDATIEHDREYSRFVESGGHDWGWLGHSIIERRDKAVKNLEETIREIVRSEMPAECEEDHAENCKCELCESWT